jgi:hypothetical protein
LAENDFALGLIAGLLIGIFIGLPAGWVVAQTFLPKGDVVALERDEHGRIIAIVEKPI